MQVLLQYQSKSYYIIGQEVYYSIGRFYYIIGQLLHYRAFFITLSSTYYNIGRLLHYRLVQRLWESPPIPTERYERRPCFCRIRWTCRSSDLLLFAKNGFVVGVRSLTATARHFNNAGCCYEYTIVSVPRIARRYTIQCSLPNTHTVHIELDGGRQAGREGGC